MIYGDNYDHDWKHGSYGCFHGNTTAMRIKKMVAMMTVTITILMMISQWHIYSQGGRIHLVKYIHIPPEECIVHLTKLDPLSIHKLQHMIHHNHHLGLQCMFEGIENHNGYMWFQVDNQNLYSRDQYWSRVALTEGTTII